MKVQRILFGQNTNTPKPQQSSTRNDFLYYPKPKEDKKFNTVIFAKVLMGLALTAVGVTLYNLKRNKVALSVVDIAESNAGLNKIKYKRTALELKKKILYPIKTGRTGKNKEFNSGLILSDKKGTPLTDVLAALNEHAEKLGIATMQIPDNLNKAERRKWVFNAIHNAENNCKKTKQFTIINIGNLDNLMDLKIVKPKKSAIEDKLIEINKNVYSGIVWTAWTNKTNAIPMYYNDLPVLVTKLVD